MKEGIQCVVYLREEVDGTPPIFTAKPPSPSPLSSPEGGVGREIAFHAIITLLLGREGE